MKQRIVSIIAALAMCLSLFPTGALAADTDTAPCPHHQEHTSDCGYTPSADENEGTPCFYECRICPIEREIADLPIKATPENADKVQERLDKISGLISELTEQEREQIDCSRCLELRAALDEVKSHDAAVCVTVNGDTTYYSDIAEAWEAAKGNTAIITLLNDTTVDKALTTSDEDDFTLSCGGYTLTGNNMETIDMSAGGILSVQNGTVANTYADGRVISMDNAVLTVEADAAIKAADSAQSIGIRSKNGLEGIIRIYGTVEGAYSGITADAGTLNVYPNAVISGGEYGIDLSGRADVSLAGGSVTGGTNAIRMDNDSYSGAVTVSNGINAVLNHEALAMPITASTAGGTITLNDSGETSQDSVSDSSAEPSPVLLNLESHSHDISVDCGNDAPTEYQPWDSTAIGGTLNGSWYLTEDITINDKTFVIGDNAGNNATLHLCLNGHTITYDKSNSYLFQLSNSNSHITICDCKNAGKIHVANGYGIIVMHWDNNSKAELYGITQEGGNGTCISSAASNSVTLENCSLKTAAGMCISNNGTLTAKNCIFQTDASPSAGIIYNTGTATIEESTFTGTGGCGIFNTINGILKLQGNLTFNSDLEYDIKLARNKWDTETSIIEIVGELTNRKPYNIGLHNSYGQIVPGKTITITKGWSTYMSDKDLADYFSSDMLIKGNSSHQCNPLDTYGVRLNESGEAEMCIPEYAITKEVTGNGTVEIKSKPNSGEGEITSAMSSLYTGAYVHVIPDATSKIVSITAEKTGDSTQTVKVVDVSDPWGKGWYAVYMPAFPVTVKVIFGKKEGDAWLNMPSWTYGSTPSEPKCTSSHYETSSLTYQYKVQDAADDTYTNDKPTKVGDYTVRVILLENDTYAERILTRNFSIYRKSVKASITGTTTKTYDGTTDAPDNLSISLSGALSGEEVTATARSYAYDSADAGENKTITATGITLSGNHVGNYILSSSTAKIAGKIEKGDQTAPSAPAATEGNITDTSITLTESVENAQYSKDGSTWQDSPVFTGLTPNTAYTFYVRLKEDNNHNASPSSTGTAITTKKTILDNAEVTISGDYIYDGTAKTPVVTVTLNGIEIPSSEYELAYSNTNGGAGDHTSAGTVTVTATAKSDGHYEGNINGSFQIKPAMLTVSGANADDRAYDGGNVVEISDVTLGGIFGTDDVSVKTTGLTGTLGGSNVGEYTSVILPALTLMGTAADNYTLTQPTGAIPTRVNIKKAAALPTKTGDLAVANQQEHVYTFGLGALRPDVPEGMSLGNTAVTYDLGTISLGDYYTGGAEIDGQTLTLPIESVSSDTAGNIGTVTVTIHTGNFNDMTAVINVRSVNKIIPTGEPTLSADTLDYGQPLDTITLSGNMYDGSTVVPGVFTWGNPQNRPVIQDSYAAAWIFTPEENQKYAIVTGIATIQILPASIADAVITLDTLAFRYDGEAHSPEIVSVKLGNTLLTAEVDYTAEVTEAVEVGTYTVTITGCNNYTGTATITFRINQVVTVNIPQEDDNGNKLKLEVEIGISKVPTAFQSDESLNMPAKIEERLKTVITAIDTSIPKENTAVYDAELLVSTDGGITWVKATAANFPSAGLTITLPYPEGTGQDTHDFVVSHMFTTNDFGKTPGTTEQPPVTKTTDGIQVTVSGLSPIAVAWKEITVTPTPTPPPIPSPTQPSAGASHVRSDRSAASTYNITLEKSRHGKVTSNKTNASNGAMVTLTITPDSGYMLDELSVTDSKKNKLKLITQGSNEFSFTMPNDNVTATAAFVQIPDETCDGGTNCPSSRFSDLGRVGTWYHDAVDYVLQKKLMDGYGNGMFGPDNILTRAQFAQILYNMEGQPAVKGNNIFSDISADAWCFPSVTWAAGQGIAGGYSNGLFGPDDSITREQLAVMLWRYAGKPAPAAKMLDFTDADKISDYALDAFCWAVEQRIISGGNNGLLSPQGLATRAQAAQMLKNFSSYK